jgi:hypothetical protein
MKSRKGKDTVEKTFIVTALLRAVRVNRIALRAPKVVSHSKLFC